MRTAAVVGAVWLLAAASACGSSQGSGSAFHEKADAPGATLQLADLAPGYRKGDDSFCGGFGVEGASERLAEFVFDRKPYGCLMEINYAWAKPAKEPLVQTEAIVVGDGDAAKDGLDVWADLLAFSGIDGARRVRDVKVGDGGFLFETTNALVRGQTGQPGVGVFWRDSNLLAMVFVGGTTDEQVALDLAAKQQARIRTPAAQPPGEDDRIVELDDPELTLPVYWLGTTFSHSGKLPPLELREGIRLTPGGGPGNEVKIDYAATGDVYGVTLDLWDPAAWKRFKETRLGLMVWSWPCTESKEIRLAKGRAVVFAGHSEPASKPCTNRPPDRFLAHGYFDGVVVAVNMPYCYSCASRGTGEDPYNSPAGMEAIVEGLRLRPKPAD